MDNNQQLQFWIILYLQFLEFGTISKCVVRLLGQEMINFEKTDFYFFL